jgi:hypothetical protein
MGSDDDCTGNAAAAAAAATDNIARDVAAMAVVRDLTGSVVPMGGDALSPLSMGINRDLRDATKGGGGMTDGEHGKKSKPLSPPPPTHAGHSEDGDVTHEGGESHTR